METGWLLPDLAEPTTSEFWLGCARGELLGCASDGVAELESLASEERFHEPWIVEQLPGFRMEPRQN